jgi:hypothetical protein
MRRSRAGDEEVVQLEGLQTIVGFILETVTTGTPP